MLAARLETLEEADYEQGEAMELDSTQRQLSNPIKDVFQVAEDRLEDYVERMCQAQEQAKLKDLLEQLQIELVNQKQTLDDTVEYIEGSMAEPNLHVAELEGNLQTLKDLAIRAKGDTVQMINPVAKLMKDTGAEQAD